MICLNNLLCRSVCLATHDCITAVVNIVRVVYDSWIEEDLGLVYGARETSQGGHQRKCDKFQREPSKVDPAGAHARSTLLLMTVGHCEAETCSRRIATGLSWHDITSVSSYLLLQVTKAGMYEVAA